ncbi:methyltransferase domain-containing protein [Frankia sp. Ag45/Mut15]|uniref:Methyltransferase domain-containing protein n=1 Tax=Frankia umida TaxID=573489 RepID=A0ABT0JT71_9ACTN|nr:methyltransferase domain-containing protein [Frankia umida]MCK9874770.1 methyltransferase domain-containing protein [Frankia umida]
MGAHPGLTGILSALRCPVCAGELGGAGAGAGEVCCAAGHSFDLGRGGYLSLRGGRSRRITGDTSAMVAARAAFLDAGYYAPLTARLGALTAAARADGRAAPTILEIGAGTGHHLAGVLTALEHGALEQGARGHRARGIAVDVAPPALRRAARAHPRIGAVSFDAAEQWPVADGQVDVLLDVFAPRHPGEMRRVLRPGGLLLVVTPGPAHLAELRGPLGLVGLHPDKDGQLAGRLTEQFSPGPVEQLDVPLTLPVTAAVDLALMGPTGHHRTRDDLCQAAAAAWGSDLESATVPVTASFRLHPFHAGSPGLAGSIRAAW